jgi:hypothetical protein
LGGKPPKGNQISSLSFTALKTPSFKGGVLRSYAQRLPKHNTSFKFSLPAAQERQNLEKKYYPPFNLFCMSKKPDTGKTSYQKVVWLGFRLFTSQQIGIEISGRNTIFPIALPDFSLISTIQKITLISFSEFFVLT